MVFNFFCKRFNGSKLMIAFWKNYLRLQNENITNEKLTIENLKLKIVEMNGKIKELVMN